MEWTRDDRLRQPVFLGIREDKNATEVVRREGELRNFSYKSLQPGRLLGR
jgi:ATP-dependent DNA ligase